MDHATAKMFCDIHWPDGRPFEGDPRFVLKQNLRRAAEKGFTCNVGPELEYFYFQSNEDVTPLDRGGYFDVTPPNVASEFRRQTILTLEQMGVNVEYAHHEAAPSQHEIDLRYTDALTMADNVMVYRIAVKEVAQRHGVYATFMPKPVANDQRQRHARPYIAVQGRPERLFRQERCLSTCRRRRSTSWPVC